MQKYHDVFPIDLFLYFQSNKLSNEHVFYEIVDPTKEALSTFSFKGKARKMKLK